MVGLARVSNEQWEFLLSFMESHPGIARGTQAFDGAHSKLAASRLWEQLAADLNNVGTGRYKSLSDWRNGTVIIIANHGDRIDIPSGAVLENKIVSGNLRILDH